MPRFGAFFCMRRYRSNFAGLFSRGRAFNSSGVYFGRCRCPHKPGISMLQGANSRNKCGFEDANYFARLFKQKTAYEIMWRDWSSDVCSSDLTHAQRSAITIARSIRQQVLKLPPNSKKPAIRNFRTPGSGSDESIN